MVPYKLGDTSGERVSEEFGLTGMHIEAVTVVQNNEIVQISSDGVKEALGPAGRSLSGRGANVCLTLWSECGKRVFVTYNFHKGDVFFQVHPLAPFDVENQDAVSELWRD